MPSILASILQHSRFKTLGEIDCGIAGCRAAVRGRDSSMIPEEIPNHPPVFIREYVLALKFSDSSARQQFKETHRQFKHKTLSDGALQIAGIEGDPENLGGNIMNLGNAIAAQGVGVDMDKLTDIIQADMRANRSRIGQILPERKRGISR